MGSGMEEGMGSGMEEGTIEVHLVDGTYELFRHHFALPSHAGAGGQEVAAVRGVLGSVLALIGDGATHVGVATDHVIESFRNAMYARYKTSAGVAPELLGQFGLLEEALVAMGVVVWPMVDLEADDALASAAAVAAGDAAVGRVLVCSPDKDLAQCVLGERVVILDRRKRLVVDESGVRARFGVGPASIPDWLALVGDAADGFPGLPRWGSASATAVLARWGTIEAIPALPERWGVQVRGAANLAASLRHGRADAMLFKDLATLRVDRSLLGSPEELRWRGPKPEFPAVCRRLDAPELVERAEAAATRAGGR
ncbi:MAG TPA: 5'-3' exonuclease H3TH domain-containing protein [Acidimicrobiales bacterium]|jgi:5'-3' exonuclease|nr:5'-3' exonuclease H3TH domain-containing protein [Acidimicrobiales bacterium]